MKDNHIRNKKLMNKKLTKNNLLNKKLMNNNLIDNNLINNVNKISDRYNVILTGNIKICGNVNCILFAHYCKSTLFYKDFFHVTKNILKVNKIANKNLRDVKRLLQLYGYQKIWTKGVFSFYGDLRPLAVEAGFGKWSDNGLITTDKYGTNFLITAIFFK